MREFLERVSPTNAIALGLILALLYYFVFFDNGDSLRSEINSRNGQIENIKKELKKIEDDIKEAQAVYDRIKFLTDKFKQAVQYLPAEWKEDILISDISKQAQVAGVTVVKLNPQKDRVKTGAYEEMKIHFEIKGTFAALMLFFSYISRIKRIIDISDVLIKSDDPEVETPTVTSIGKFTAYRYIPPQERNSNEATSKK